MPEYSEKRDIKPGVWADGMLKSLALQVEGQDETPNPKKTTMLLDPLDFGEKLKLHLVFTNPIEIPSGKNIKELEFTVWMFRKSGTERQNKMIYKEKLPIVKDEERIKLPSLVDEEIGRAFNLRIGILEKSENPELPSFIAGEKIFRIAFALSEFPTRYCKFSEMGWPKAIWSLEIYVDDPEEPLYSEQEPNLIVNLNEDFPEFVRLTKTSAARSPELKASHIILMNLMYYDVVLQLSDWVLQHIIKNDSGIPDYEVDSIGFIVMHSLKKFLKCKNLSEVVDLYKTDSTIFQMLLQEATKLSESFKPRSDI